MECKNNVFKQDSHTQTNAANYFIEMYSVSQVTKQGLGSTVDYKALTVCPGEHGATLKFPRTHPHHIIYLYSEKGQNIKVEEWNLLNLNLKGKKNYSSDKS